MDRSEVLSDLDFLSRLLSAFPLLHEPAGGPTPVVAIQYSPSFKFVMGLYNYLNRMNRDQSFPSEEYCPSWLLSLAYALSVCAPHYSAWQQRREVVMNAKHFERCFAGKSAFFMSAAAAAESRGGDEEEEESRFEGAECDDYQPMLRPKKDKKNWRMHAVEGVDDKDEATPPTLLPFSDLSVLDRKRLEALLPSVGDFIVDSCASSTATGDDAMGAVQPLYSPWHAVRWELRQSAATARKSHKNFQIWHHRKELIAFAMRATASNEKSTFADAGDCLFRDSANPMPFSDIDDRVLCDEILLKLDSKNYHVWQHRAWFISAFSFLHHVDIADCMAHTLPMAETAPPSIATSFSEIPPFVDSAVFCGGKVIPLYHSILDNRRRMPRGMHFPNCAIQKEIDYSTILITDDVFNNSAWSYRMHLIEQYILPRFVSAMRGDSEEKAETINSACVAFLAFVLEEVSYAVTQAGKEVCNECPFVYARGICDVYSRVLNGSNNASDGDATVLKAMQRAVRLLTTGSADEKREDESTTNTSPSSASDTSAYSEELIVTLVHRSLLHALTVDILPIVRQVRKEMKDSRTPYGQRTNFIKFNTHQCEAGMFHLGSSIIGLLRCSLERKGRFSQALVPLPDACDDGGADDSTVLDGQWLMGMASLTDDAVADLPFFTRDRSKPLFMKVSRTSRREILDGSSAIGNLPSHTLATMLIAHERNCLDIAKKMFIIDEIRNKYWRFEVKRIAFREEL